MFQPIFSSNDNEMFGYEALIRGPSDSPLHSPLKLFESALESGLLSELELACRQVSIERFVELGLPGRLFLNVSPMIFLSDDHPQGKTLSFLKEYGLSPRQVVIELSEKYPYDDPQILKKALTHYRDLGFQVAIDDLGAGYAGLKLWSEVKPDFVKIDRYFVNQIHKDPIKREFVKSIVNLGNNTHSEVIAEGIETEEEFEQLQDLGIKLGQGFLLARPEQYPGTDLPEVIIRNQRHNLECSQPKIRVRSLLKHADSIDYCQQTEQVIAHLHQNPHLHSIPVIQDHKPVGMVLRESTLELYSTPYGRALNAKKSIAEVLSNTAVIVDINTPLEKVAKLVTNEYDDRLPSYFIITEHNQYVGIGSVRDLLRQLTQQQIQYASYANPLTQLPGNVPIHRKIDELLAARQPFHLAYVDLNNFKPYNDVYGYAMGDQVIKMVANLLRKHCNQNDFIGHIGGDDFVVIFESERWQSVSANLTADFDREIPHYYDQQDVITGGIHAKSREGIEQMFPLLCIAVGVVSPDPQRCHSHHEVSELAADAKKEAKRFNHSAVFKSRRRGPQIDMDAATSSATSLSVA